MAANLLFLTSSTSIGFCPRHSIHVTTPLHCRAPTRRLTISAVSSSATPDLLDISKLGISDHIVSSLSFRGITELFPIQRAVFEPAMEGRDMIGRAITGSGKTLAFGIPILDKIIQNQSQHRKKRVPSALVLAPTRELARQVQREFEESAPNLSSTCLYGGVPINTQIRSLRVGIDIAVGTPGRIIDLVERGALNLSEVKFVVLDEADQMLAVGFEEDVERILDYLPSKKQSMLFSATMPSWVKDLSKKYLKNPLVIDLVGNSDKKLAESISLFSIASNASGKQNLLPVLISQYGKEGKTIIFTKTRKDAENLSQIMERVIGSKALHGNMHQTQRDRTIAAFSKGRFNVLVATDVAARGLDIPDVDLVIHFEMPNTSEIFVHRSGRTGRAGKKGTTVLMFTEGQRRDVRLIERDLRFKFEELPRNDSRNQNDFVGRRGSSHSYNDESAGRRNQSDRRGSSYSNNDNSAGRWNQDSRRGSSYSHNDNSAGRWNQDSRRGSSYSHNDNSASRWSQGDQSGSPKQTNSRTLRFSKERSTAGNQQFRKNNKTSFSDSDQSHYSQPWEGNASEYMKDYSINGKRSKTFAMNNTRNSQRPRFPRYKEDMLGSERTDAIYTSQSNFSNDERSSSSSKPNSFDQILDMFQDS
ncbi:DEAD-box ATP-dependent RNA helicase 53 [Zostera marina]|uniref:DEAD-box ATP-dependent RNA helicase 53 n=1 Tax=Zostera marina TaxID=29655 RepID=A0A0K9Q4N1_ZOSMR|nr:DEAD-box ATP-dependent RNA helicase 53 [Zostera marina]